MQDKTNAKNDQAPLVHMWSLEQNSSQLQKTGLPSYRLTNRQYHKDI